MAKSKNNLSGLINELSRARIDGQSAGKLLAPTSVITQPNAGTEKTLKAPSADDARMSSTSAKTVPTGINFGKPSSNAGTASQSGKEWTDLLQQTASGGAASIFGGGLGSILGLGGLISGIASLFGGGSNNTPPPLVEFQLPSSQTQTVYVNSNASSTYQGSVADQASTSQARSPIYGSSGTPQTSSSGASGQSLQYQSSQIAEAVKIALLNSSSLNDVIAEI